MLLLALPCQASSRWTTALPDDREAALALGGAALEQGSDPAQWSSLKSLRLQALQVVGPGESLGQALQLAGPLAHGLSFGMEASQLRGDDNRMDGRARQSYRDARLRFGLAMAEPLVDGRPGLAYGAALNYYDHTEGAVRRYGGSYDLSVRSPLARAWAVSLALRDMKIANGYSDELPGEGVLGLAYGLGRVGLGYDLALPMPSLGRGPPVSRLAATFAPNAWSQLLLGCSSSEVPGQGGHFGFGGSLRQGDLELSLSAAHRPQPERTSLHAGLAWHFSPSEAAAKPAYKAPAAKDLEPEPTPEAETGSFDLQAAFRDGQIHVAWPGSPMADGGYEVLMGLVQGATMKKMNPEALHEPRWSGTPGMLGMTYYFRVRTLDKNGVETARSRLCALQVPAKETP